MLYELSVPMYPGMPRYDAATPGIHFDPNTRTPADPNNTTNVTFFLHAGSHVDAPFHFDGAGRTIDQIPIERFRYQKAITAIIPKKAGERVSAEELKSVPHLDEADLLLIYTGYSEYIDNEPIYQKDFPALDISAARYLRRECPKLEAVGIDSLSIEVGTANLEGFPVHHELLNEADRSDRSLLVYENLDLRPVHDCSSFYKVYAFPVRLKGLDAAPVNVVAEF